MNQAATAQYNLRNFDEAQALFEELRRRDPDRLEVSSPSNTPIALYKMQPVLQHSVMC